MAGRTGKCRAWVTPLLALGLWLTPSIQAQTARNPHGPISIACENCHTTTSFSPLRAQPEFDHSRTQFPLRGMHQNVACKSCHVSNVFTEAGTQCANCHADFHRRQFGAQCENCHTVQGWTVATRSVQDHLNRFPLFGGHAAVACEACHRGAATGVYTGLSTQCVTCHQQDFQQAKSVDHRAAGFPTTCDTCHSVNNWQLARFDHNQFAKFQLTGAHATVPCASCHVGGHYQGTATTCVGCHAKDFATATSPNHVAAGFPQTCETCHNTVQWLGAKFDHSTTRFPLTGKHTTVTCAQCHANGQYATLPTTCVSCHLPDYQKTTAPNHIAASFPQTCETCHNTVQWLGAKFDHSTTRFPLTGKHTTVTCAQCHANGQYATLPTTCVSCHLPDYQKTTTPNHIASGFPQTCETCHNTTQWLGAVFNHNATKFPLTGKHTTVACATCHTNGQYATLPTTCVSCHLPDYQKTTTPNHVASGFPQTCETCHNTTQWLGAVFNHNATKFPLTGKHTTVACAACHVNGQYATLPTTCVSCHLPDYQKTTTPNHIAASFPQTCDTCHNTTQWLGATFNHNNTKFPLTGKHTTVACATCHANGQYATLPTTCVSCHLPDFQQANAPNHVAAGFPQTCDTCHNTTQWLGASFNHNTTKFPLTGKHTTVACATCHVNNQYATLPTTCVSCHLTDFQQANAPNHVAAGFPQDCTLCHNTTQWLGATFNHNTTKFPLTGKHTTVACATCHANGQYATLPTTCVSCHLPDFQQANAPNHVAAGFPQTCDTCHNTTQWLGATFNHNTTKFPLTGKHTTVACATCHVNNQYATLPTTCVSCHLPDYQNATSPNHVAAGFPQDCTLCHNTTQWPGATFNHSATKFPLTGKHTTVACLTCHVNNQYATLPTTCVSCHLPEYQATTNPNHVAAGFPQTCDTCHNTTQWPGATFNHNTTAFPLTGKHTTTACASCHINGVYKGTPTLCYSCHAPEYKSTTNPNHVAAGFPTTCETCHNTTQWPGATFNHTWFPITSGNHNVPCASCHTNSSNYTVFSCMTGGCHSQTTTDNHHQGVKGYVYNAINCYSCHPTGRN